VPTLLFVLACELLCFGDLIHETKIHIEAFQTPFSSKINRGPSVYHQSSISGSKKGLGGDFSPPEHGNIENEPVDRAKKLVSRRNALLSSMGLFVSPMTAGVLPHMAMAVESDDTGSSGTIAEQEKVLVILSGETKQLFNEGRAKEMQGNIASAYRIYSKVTNIVPRFIYGWSSLGNTQVIIGKLNEAETSYSKAIDLCKENLDVVGDQFGVRRCDDLYVLYLNRGSLRLNNYMQKEALRDLDLAATLRGKPDAIILQNRARARELNSQYGGADRDYDVSISMTSNEVAPFWLRSAMVKFQLGDTLGAMDLLRRVEVKFPEAPEVRAALAAMLWKKGDQGGAKRKFLEIPNAQRLNFGNDEYLTKTVSWPPQMIDNIKAVSASFDESL